MSRSRTSLEIRILTKKENQPSHLPKYYILFTFSQRLHGFEGIATKGLPVYSGRFFTHKFDRIINRLIDQLSLIYEPTYLIPLFTRTVFLFMCSLLFVYDLRRDLSRLLTGQQNTDKIGGHRIWISKFPDLLPRGLLLSRCRPSLNQQCKDNWRFQ